MCTLWSDNTCVFTQIHSLSGALHGYAVRDKRSYLPRLKIVIHTVTNYEISQHMINKSLRNKYH